MVGYHSLQSKPKVLRDDETVLDFGTIWVIPELVNLKEVIIRGQKPLIEQRVDGIVFNTERLSSIAGLNASDVLKRVPMISVDPSGGLSVNGNSNIRVFIDGKPSELYAPSVAGALKAISAENIVKIEVITHPSAKYDAEGTDAVVNIITRKPKTNGSSGNLSVALGNRSENTMGDMLSKYGKWLFNADALYQKYWNRNGSVLERETGSSELLQKNESKQSGDYFFGGANILYSPDSLNTLSIGYRARISPNVTSNVLESYEVKNEMPLLSFLRHTRTPNTNKGNTFNAGYTRTSKNGKKEFSLLAMYFLFKGTNDYQLEQVRNDVIDYLENFGSRTHNHDFIIQGDYSQSFNKRWKWESGIKLTLKQLKSESRFNVYNFLDAHYIPDALRSTHFSYRSNIYALYNNLTLKLKKWGLTGGVRYERTELDAVFKEVSLRIPAFSNMVPQILVSRMFDEKTSLKLSYNMKILRPYFSYLNPTVNNSDSLTIQFGNPYLKPEITNRYQLSFTANDTKLFKDLTLFFNDNRNTIENIRTALPGSVFESTWKNIGQNQQLGLVASLTWKPTAALDIGGTFTARYTWLKSRALGITNKGLTGELVIRSTYAFQKGYSIYFYGFFNNRNLRLQGYRSGWKYYSITVSKKWKNERFNISLKMDAFLTPFTYIDEELATNSFRQLQTFRYQNRYISLGFSWKLGKTQIKNQEIRQVEHDD